MIGPAAVSPHPRLLDRLMKLQIGDDEGWSDQLPWSRFLLQLGSALAAQTIQASKSGALVRALVLVPVARHAPSLLALPLLLERFLEDPWLSDDLEAHVELLTELPVGTPVLLRTNNVIFRGHYLGPGTKAGGDAFGVKLQHDAAGGLGRWIPRVAALKIEPDPQGLKKLPLNPEGKRVSRESSLLHPVLGAAAYPYLHARRRELMLIGPRARLEEEFGTLRLGGHGQTATLQQLVRVREFGGNKGRFAADWCAARASSPPQAPVALFARASDYVRDRGKWNSSHCVVVTETGEDRLPDVIQAFTDTFHEEAGRTVQLPGGMVHPVGVSVWAYWGQS